MAALNSLFALQIGTPIGVNAAAPLNLADRTAQCTALVYSTIAPGGFEALTASFGPDGIAVDDERPARRHGQSSQVGATPMSTTQVTWTRGSINRVTVSGVADVNGTLQDTSNTTCKVTITDWTSGASYLAATAMTYVSPGVWQNDVPAGTVPLGVATLIAVTIYDQTGVTLRRTVYAQGNDGGY